MKKLRIVLAFGLMFFFAFLIWKPSITGQVTSLETQTVVVVLKPEANTNSITGAVTAEQRELTIVQLKEATANAQEEVLEDVNSPSFIEKILNIDSAPDVITERIMEIVPAMVVEATPEGIEELKNHPLVEAVYPNIMFDLVLDESVPLINADDIWPNEVNGVNIDGAGVSVCVVDTGILPHEDFQDRIVNEKCFCSPSCCPNGQATDNIATDTHSLKHGTHVSGIVGAGGIKKGVAPGVNIVAVKVCNTGCGLADIMAGIDYCAQVKDQFNVVAISGSIGNGGRYKQQSECPTFFDSAINTAYNLGITSVFASGNNGYKDGISYPGCSLNSIAVGATDKADNVAGFSNRGTLMEVYAPGVSISSTVNNNNYGVLSGTSQATPHVSGAVALIQQYTFQSFGSFLTPDQIKNVLVSTGVIVEGFPRIDLLAALQSLGLQPDQNNPPVPLINIPTENSTIQNPILLQGSATDDGNITSLVWSENSVTLGTGNSIQINLSAGNHTITLTATDDKNAIASINVNFIVSHNQTNNPPIPVINNPQNNSTIQNPVTFEGNATDPEDGSLSNSSLEWFVNSSSIGTNAMLTNTLAPGKYTATLVATDSEELSAQTSVTFDAFTCHLNIDRNNNENSDVGDFVILLNEYSLSDIPCLQSQAPCIVELDKNSNGGVDIGDFVLLLSDFAFENIKNINGDSC